MGTAPFRVGGIAKWPTRSSPPGWHASSQIWL